MKWKMKILMLAFSCSVMTACTNAQPQVQSPSMQTETPATASPINEPRDVPSPMKAPEESVMPKAAPADKPVVDKSAWVGEWKWQQATKYDVSTITIHSQKDKQLTFSLNAFHVTNAKTMDGHHGEIDKGIAFLSGDEAVFRDDDNHFELRMALVDGHLEVSTKGEGDFGAFVTVDGSYVRKTNDYLIVPGRSVGKISLGMSKKEVTKLLGKPSEADESQMTYKSAKNSITLELDNNVVRQIEFTSSSFSTAEGINLSNFQQLDDGFAISQFQWRFLQLRYGWEEGGLTFFSFNADVPDDNEEYQSYVRGYVYEGRQMFEEPITGAQWEPVSKQ
ncbi:hypothetical protein [Cohnella mopanensis]|uniref:hypothetical protein n=1 Tax=Cohnella mopanensis TaxID=2911966 RepID=UPI001EF955E3|nr:hypothetical protein [Cohnella mopanensis]